MHTTFAAKLKATNSDAIKAGSKKKLGSLFMKLVVVHTQKKSCRINRVFVNQDNYSSPRKETKIDSWLMPVAENPVHV